MNMNKLLALAETLKTEPKKEKPRYRVRNGKIVIRMAAILAKPKPASNIVEFAPLPREVHIHKVGDTCPHCMGKRRYSWHLTERTEKCFRCNGKGILDARDIAFLRARVQESRPICKVVTA